METHTQRQLAAQGGGAAAEGLRGVVGLGAQLGDGGEVRPVAVLPDVEGDLERHGREEESLSQFEFIPFRCFKEISLSGTMSI